MVSIATILNNNLGDVSAFPVSLIQGMSGDSVEIPIWDVYKNIAEKHDKRRKDTFGKIERFAFYEKAKKACSIIAPGEKTLCTNLILQKGVI